VLYYIFKFGISAFLIVLVSELAKKNSLLGGLIASLPLVSVLAILWLYIDTKSIERASQLSINIFWMVIPSLALFLVFPYLLKLKLNFYISLTSSCCITAFFYFLMMICLKKFGVKF